MTAIKFPSLLFTPGRDCGPATAVVLHEYKSGLEMLDKQMDDCRRPRPLCSPSCHTSFHYGIGACHLHQYINLEDTAWGFWFEPTPVCPVPPCPVVQECDGVGPGQYNPDFDGNPATPDVDTSPTCMDANCSVIHVAVITGTTTVSDGIFCINSPTFSESAYRCLVQALCEIFDAAGLLPVSGTTLLTHIGELVNVDVDTLAIDILACLNAPTPPLPPCNCTVEQTPITVVDTATLDLTASGTDSHTLTGNVRVSSVVGNVITINGDGLYVAPAGGETPITANDTNSVNITASGVSNHTIAADVIISPNANNQVSVLGNGVFGDETLVTVNDSTTVGFSVSGFANHTITADVKISGSEGNQISVEPSGLYVPPPTFPVYNTCGGPLVEEIQTITTVEAFLSEAPTNITNAIWATNTDDPCPARLRVDECTGSSMPQLTVVLGGTGNSNEEPKWGQVQRPTLSINNFTNGTTVIGPNGADVFNYISNVVHSVTLAVPTDVCDKNDLWVKNSGTNTLTINSAATIDGVASITLLGTSVGGYAFGTNGGESVHLIYNGTSWIIV